MPSHVPDFIDRKPCSAPLHALPSRSWFSADAADGDIIPTEKLKRPWKCLPFACITSNIYIGRPRVSRVWGFRQTPFSARPSLGHSTRPISTGASARSPLFQNLQRAPSFFNLYYQTSPPILNERANRLCAALTRRWLPSSAWLGGWCPGPTSCRSFTGNTTNARQPLTTREATQASRNLSRANRRFRVLDD